MGVGYWIKQYRKKNNISQEDFGRIVGVNKQTVSRWEKGILQPSADKYYEIADAIKIPIEHILESTDDKENIPVFSDNRKFIFGLNSIHNAIYDYDTLCVFLDMIIEMKHIINSEVPVGRMFVSGNVVEIDEIDNVDEQTMFILDFDINYDYIDIIFPYENMESISIYREIIKEVKPKENFNNILYVIDIVIVDGTVIKLGINLDVDENDIVVELE